MDHLIFTDNETKNDLQRRNLCQARRPTAHLEEFDQAQELPNDRSLAKITDSTTSVSPISSNTFTSIWSCNHVPKSTHIIFDRFPAALLGGACGPQAHNACGHDSHLRSHGRVSSLSPSIDQILNGKASTGFRSGILIAGRSDCGPDSSFEDEDAES
jgi:hypothetical protein